MATRLTEVETRLWASFRSSSCPVGNVSSGGGGCSTSRTDAERGRRPRVGLDAARRRLREHYAVLLEEIGVDEFDVHPEARARGVARAVPRSRPSTSGTCTWAGPSETVSTIVVPGRCSDPPAGSWAMTVFSGRSEFWKTGEPAVNPAFSMAAMAVSRSSPTTDGTETCLMPRETLMNTVSPSASLVPRARLLRRDGADLLLRVDLGDAHLEAGGRQHRHRVVA